MVMVLNLEQPEKASSLIVVTPLGISILVKLLQPSKAL